MTPGFHASEGCWFHAFIHPCDHEGNSFRSFTPVPPVQEEQREESEWSGPDRTIEHPYPDPTTGEFTLLKDPERAAASVVAMDPSGREVKIEFMDQGDRLQFSLAKDNAAGLYAIFVTYKDGTWERTSVCLAR